MIRCYLVDGNQCAEIAANTAEENGGELITIAHSPHDGLTVWVRWKAEPDPDPVFDISL